MTVQDLKIQQEAEYFQNRDEAEMEMSDGEDATESNGGKRKRSKVETSTTHSTESMMTMASGKYAVLHFLLVFLRQTPLNLCSHAGTVDASSLTHICHAEAYRYVPILVNVSSCASVTR